LVQKEIDAQIVIKQRISSLATRQCGKCGRAEHNAQIYKTDVEILNLPSTN